MMRLGILRKRDSITVAVWLRLPTAAKLALIGLGLRAGDVSLGMIAELR